jgi:phosphatidate cytidylyltransferase
VTTSEAATAETGKKKSDLGLRLATAGVFAPIILGLLYAGPPWGFPVLCAITASFAAYELFSMVAPEHLSLRIYAVLASLVVLSGIVVPSLSAYFGAIAIGLIAAGMLMCLARPEPIASAASRMGWSIAGPIYVGASFGALAAIFNRDHGGSWVVLALLFSFMSDTAGYFVGRKWGKHKLSPLVSPKKTVEGSVGGLLAGLVSGLVMHAWLLPTLPLLDAIVLSLVATAVGQAGDLCESLIKRSANVKDSGAVLPGHGGFLDRSDAMMFTAMVVWAYVTFTGK